MLDELRAEDPEFEAVSRADVRAAVRTRSRTDHPLPAALGRAAAASGVSGRPVGMSFWTDAAMLGEAGIPSRPLRARRRRAPQHRGVRRIADVHRAAATRWPRCARDWCGIAVVRLSVAHALSGVFRSTARAATSSVASGVTLVALPRSRAADLPAGRVVSAGRAAHVHAIAFEVQNRIVAAKPAEQLAEPAHRTRHDRLRRRALQRSCPRGRELLGIIGHHGQSPCSLSSLAMTPAQ